MLRLTTLTGCAILLAAFLVGTGRSGGGGGAPPKRVGLPKYWSRIGLGDDQKKKIIKIRTDYQMKIQTLRDQIAKLAKEEQKETFAQLSADQRERLRKIIVEKSGGEPPPPEKKKGTDKKAPKEP